jgi:hypothetical protein
LKYSLRSPGMVVLHALQGFHAGTVRAVVRRLNQASQAVKAVDVSSNIVNRCGQVVVAP